MMGGMRELTVGEFGVLLSLFAVLLLAFSADFHLSRKSVRSHHRAAVAFACISLVGELSTAIAILFTWIALWSETAWDRIPDMWVLVPGSLSVLCALLLTIETVVGRARRMFADDEDEPDGAGTVGLEN